MIIYVRICGFLLQEDLHIYVNYRYFSGSLYTILRLYDYPDINLILPNMSHPVYIHDVFSYNIWKTEDSFRQKNNGRIARRKLLNLCYWIIFFSITEKNGII
jgi:hypothetical protein